MDLGLFLPFAMEGAKQVIDAAVDGAKLNRTGQKVVQSAYSLATIIGEDAVASTETKVDDQALDQFKLLCEDTAKEGNFPLPALSNVA